MLVNQVARAYCLEPVILRVSDYEELANPRNLFTSPATEFPRLSAASCVDASAYTRIISSVPDGRTKDRP